MTNLFVPKEIVEGERRVAAVPETVKRFVKMGCAVTVESGAGLGARISDEEYRSAGATIAAGWEAPGAHADLILKVREPVKRGEAGGCETDMMSESTVLVTTLQPFENAAAVRKLLDRKVTAFSMDFIPRISRAQKMDSLSSQSNLAGYKAVLMAANALEKYFPMLMTAAGTIRPARVVVIGAGVAGLQAVATARRLGAVVEVSDVRPDVKEQVQSLGAKFIELETGEQMQDSSGYAKEATPEFLAKQRQLLHDRIAQADVVICTALVPGRKAPVIVGADMVRAMKPGSVIVDLAVERGGNCELSEAGKEIEVGGVKILGRLNVPSSMAVHASETYARNIANFVQELLAGGEIKIDMENEVLRGSLITYRGTLMQDVLKDAMGTGGDDE